jgi:hypothetical protein
VANVGIAPPDYDTDLGQLRAVLGDTAYVALVPPVSGQGDYVWFADESLLVFLSLAEDDVDAAAIYGWNQMGDILAAEAASITTDDLRVDTTKRAQFFYDRAARAQETLGGDVFALATLGSSTCVHAELAGWYYGYCSCP